MPNCTDAAAVAAVAANKKGDPQWAAHGSRFGYHYAVSSSDLARGSDRRPSSTTGLMP